MDKMGVFRFGFLVAVFVASICFMPSVEGACCQNSNWGIIGAQIGQITSGDYCCYNTIPMTGARVPYCCDFTTFVENSTGLTIGAIIGIVIGCLVAVILAFVLLCCCCGCCCFG